MDTITHYPVWKRGLGYNFVACSVRQYGSSPFAFRPVCTMCGDVSPRFGTREQATEQARTHEAEHA